MNARIRRVLDCDREAADQLRAEMGLLRDRLASTRQMMNDYRASKRRERTAEDRVAEQVP
jgi:hypothetical protein